MKEGLTYLKKEQKEGYEQLFHEQSIQTKIVEDIKSIYHHKFIEVIGLSRDLFTESGALPHDLEFLDSREEIQKYIGDKSFLWLTFEFSTAVFRRNSG